MTEDRCRHVFGSTLKMVGETGKEVIGADLINILTMA